MVNGNINENTERFPVFFNSAYTAGRAAVMTTQSASGEQRAIQAAVIGQDADLSLIPRFLGVGPDDVSNGRVGSVQRHGRIRAQGGGAIVAPNLVTFDANGKFIAFVLDATKFCFIVGYAASDCAGDLSFFDLVIAPMIIGPASATGVTFALTQFLEQTEMADPAAPAANKSRLYAKDNGAGKTQLVVRFPTGAVQVIATEP